MCAMPRAPLIGPDPAEAPDGSRRARELAILNAIAQALNASVDLRDSLSAALSHVADLLGLRTGWVFLLDEQTGEPYLAAAQSLPKGLAEHPGRMTGSCYCLDTFRAGDLNGAANVNVVTCSRLKWLAGEGTEGLRFHASIPLYAHGRRLGVMNVASPEWRQLSPDDLRILHTVGDMLGVAVDRARLYAASVEAGAAQERNRLAREIHDTLAQGLSATALHLDTADALLAAGAPPERIRAAIEKALQLTRSNLEEARRSVLDLRAAPLEGRTLAQALATLAEASWSEVGPLVRVDVEGSVARLPAGIESGLYRIGQEALANALRHAAAQVILLRLRTTPDRIVLSIEDDGHGFEPDAAIAADRFGLVGLRERARLLGGTLTIESAPGTGTRIVVAVPLA
jgi:two-component system NarL family sensor kinase